MAEVNHPVRLEQLTFTRSIVVAVPGHVPDPGKMTDAPENNIQVSKLDEQGTKYQVSMRCQLNREGGTAAPYIVDMECYAVLDIDPDLDEQTAHRGATITGHSVCYGAIREAVAWITGRQPYGQLMLGLSVLQGKSTETKE